MEPSFAIAVVVFQDKLLVVSRRGNSEDLGCPGGKIEPGETPKQAAIRELEEETGLIAKSVVEIYNRHEETADNKICRAYLVKQYEGELSSPEGLWVGWVPASRLLEENCSFRRYYKDMFINLAMVSLNFVVFEENVHLDPLAEELLK